MLSFLFETFSIWVELLSVLLVVVVVVGFLVFSTALIKYWEMLIRLPVWVVGLLSLFFEGVVVEWVRSNLSIYSCSFYLNIYCKHLTR